MFTPAVKSPELATPVQRVFLCADGGLLVREAPEVTLPPPELLARAGTRHHLGQLNGDDCWAARWSEPPPSGLAVRSLRSLWGALPEPELEVAGRAVQIVDWDETHRFCGKCGGPTELSTTERSRRCPRCALSFWPRLAPAVIVLVRRGDQVLLARNGRMRVPMFSTLAGFVEPGESLEDTVHRELREEVGVQVKDLRYFGSQPWPFPNSLMLGFNAEYAGGELTVDGEEIVEAGWFKAGALPMVPPRVSIARQLIDAWLREQGALPSPG